MLTLGPSTSFAAPKQKPVTLSSALAPYQASNTVGAAAANSGYQGIVNAFPSSVPSTGPSSPGGVAATPAIAGSDYGQQVADLVAPTARAVSAQGVTNLANLSAQRRQAIIAYGYVPPNLSGQLQGDVNADLDPSTPGGLEARQLADAATASGVSTYAQLQKAYHDKQAGDWANLAARGMVHSGAAGQHMGADLLDYNQGSEAGIAKLMDTLSGYYQTYLTAQATGQTTLADATSTALKTIIAQIEAGQYQSPVAATPYQPPVEPSVSSVPVSTPPPLVRTAAPKPAAKPKPYQPLVGRDY